MLSTEQIGENYQDDIREAIGKAEGLGKLGQEQDVYESSEDVESTKPDTSEEEAS